MLDLLNIGLRDMWQEPILDKTLGPVMYDCLIDWNGTVHEYKDKMELGSQHGSDGNGIEDTVEDEVEWMGIGGW